MKEIVGCEARIYNYMENVFKTVGSYYNYEYIKMSLLDTNNMEDKIIDYYDSNIKNGFKKYCYNSSSYINNIERNEFGFLVLGSNSYYQDAEIISMNYRILEELKLEDIIVHIKAVKDYDIHKLQEYLEQLDIDFEINNSDGLLNDNILLSFEIIMEVKDKKIALTSGYKNSKNISSINYLDNILEVLNVIYEGYEFDTLIQVTIVGDTEEERIVGMRLAQDLRWCEIKVDIDTNNKSKDEQLNGINSNFIIVIEKDNLNKGLIKVIDNLTHEETLIDENEIIDYIVSNM